MQKGLKTRLIAHNLLFELKNKGGNFDELLNKVFEKNNLSISDQKFIHNIVLSSMRFHIHVSKIVSKYIKKKLTSHQIILFLSSVTQIVYLDFKEYAVVNSTVELSKNKTFKVYPGFINAVLKKITKDKELLKKTQINASDLPIWIYNEIKNIPNDKKKEFLDSIVKKPNLHLVFKKEINKGKFNIKSVYTSKKSLAVDENIEIDKIPGYHEGEWWVQDYATMMPLHILHTGDDLKNKKIIDLCAAPGGKSFQALSAGAEVDIVEISNKRAKILKENLERLKFKKKIIVSDAININNSKKYDYVLIDAPCSSSGTLRRNPEIFYRKTTPNLKELSRIQESLLDKARELLEDKGIIIYMVCSFLESETSLRIENFLKKNKNFSTKEFTANSEGGIFLNKNGYLKIFPQTLNGINIDGFFAVQLKKND